MAFMVPVVKKDYDIYSKSPPKNKPIVKMDRNAVNNNNNNGSQKSVGGRQQSNSITLALIQHQKQQRQRNPQRIHSKSCNETHIARNERQRSTSNSNSSNSVSSGESLEIVRKMMHFISLQDNSKNLSNSDDTNNKSQNKSQQKTHWTAKIFRKRKNSLNNHKLS